MSTTVPATTTTTRAELPDLNRVAKASLWHRLLNTDLLLALGAALIAVLPMAVGLSRYPTAGGDEGIYASQADAILHGQITPYTYTYDHPFVGWLQISPVAWLFQQIGIGGQLTVVNTRAVMVLYAFVSLALIYGIMRRFGAHQVFAVGAVFALGISPLFIDESRQVYLDNIALVWVLAALYLVLSPSRRQWTYGIAGVLLGIGALSKETVLLLIPAFIYLVWVKSYKPIRLMCMAAFVALGVMTVCIYPLFAALRHELFPGAGHVSLWDNGIMYQLANRKGSGSLWQHNSDRYNLWQSWLDYDHWLMYVGGAAALLTLGSKRYRSIGMLYLLWLLPVLKPGGYLPAMYVIVGLPFMAMGMAACGDLLTKWIMARTRLPIWTTVGALVTTWMLILASLLVLVPRTKLNVNADVVAPQTKAVSAMIKDAGPKDNILTDSAFWLDLVDAGHGSVANPWHGAVDYYQFDLDPVSSNKELPQGWRDIDFILYTPEMQANIKYLGLTKLKQAVDHSTVVHTYGHGDNQIEIREVRPTLYNHR